MQLSRLLFLVSLLLAPLALLGTTWLYTYPLLHGCAFPLPPANTSNAPAPFRLLALGDPQLEGDSSLPDPNALVFPSLAHFAQHYDLWDLSPRLAKNTVKGIAGDVGVWLEGKRKAVDLWGNDLYLAHIVSVLRWWTRPSHVAVLGDLLGSQWISDGEFEGRGRRYWGVVMRGLQKVPDWFYGVLGADESWSKRVINIAGNHDIGYAGDLDESRIARFEQAFGSVNWDIWFTLPASTTNTTSPPPALRLIILNSMNLDTPALAPALQTETYDFLNHLISTSRPVADKSVSTILLTHIPLHKEAGICVDAPFFDFFNGDEGGGVKEQNMLSDHASKMLLEGIFGLGERADGGSGRRGVIVGGHDHEGCGVLHYLGTKEEEKSLDETVAGDALTSARRYASSLPLPDAPHLREITLRSMMGDFGGYAGFLSAWFDAELGEWQMGFETCGVGVQHWWWGVHVVDLIAVLVGVAGVLGYYGLFLWVDYGCLPHNYSGVKVAVKGKRIMRD
ncbi:hypothetical protein P153DRAFT_426562 [Dothidotthia symphoricarpi CBS 119687]|uniref:Calcineurin-like phosphoesterase domain-containing protein n=1 Tax=Dothidotthia symphoricarpi CBS 119687 TaxID=1392245 RepID=A0A6A6A096_9PLEO|nr:uncharacterized protein P153DRAFT_426562 [Dothidotthia symphoricarpi CBS 119687]KAF2124573.1 hypothetical protein P153DRAFT_426562 [Dothidotthia symphoricarpi CBS 119687]